MGDSVSRQFQKTDIEIEQAVAAFVRKIEFDLKKTGGGCAIVRDRKPAAGIV